MKYLSLLLLMAGLAVADPVVIVENLQPWNAPGALQPPGPPMVLVIIYDVDTKVASYSVTLPWLDQFGMWQSATQVCAASQVSPNTACVFDVNASNVGVPTVTPSLFARAIQKEERRK